MKGEDFREYLLLRMDGEDWTSDEHVVNDVTVSQQADFVGWDVWKEKVCVSITADQCAVTNIHVKRL